MRGAAIAAVCAAALGCDHRRPGRDAAPTATPSRAPPADARAPADARPPRSAPDAPSPLIGIWQLDSPEVGAGYGELLALHADGRFERRPPQSACDERLVVARGTWTLERDALVLHATTRTVIVGGQPGDPTSEDCGVTGGQEREEPTDVVARSPIAACAASQTTPYEGASGPCTQLDGHAWFRVSADPDHLP